MPTAGLTPDIIIILSKYGKMCHCTVLQLGFALAWDSWSLSHVSLNQPCIPYCHLLVPCSISHLFCPRSSTISSTHPPPVAASLLLLHNTTIHPLVCLFQTSVLYNSGVLLIFLAMLGLDHFHHFQEGADHVCLTILINENSSSTTKKQKKPMSDTHLAQTNTSHKCLLRAIATSTGI